MTKYQLLRVIRVQEVDMFFNGKGIKRTKIYREIIEPCFFISRSTYYSYLGINAKSLLKKTGYEWKEELSKNIPVDYMGLMKIMDEKDILSINTYHDMLK